MLPLWRRIHHAFEARGQKWLPLNARQALVHLHLHPEDGEPAVLAAETQAPRQTMTFVLDTLETQGLAVRRSHPSDRRRKRIELTRKGSALAAKILKDVLAFEAVALSAIPADALDTFRRLVSCYADALTRQNQEPPRI